MGRSRVHSERSSWYLRGLRPSRVKVGKRLCERIRLRRYHIIDNKAIKRLYLQDFMIGLVIWCSMDPTNFFVPPAVGPWLVSFV